MIKVENLCVKLGELELFNNVNLNIEKEKISIIVGPNGAGKTTLIKTFAKILKPKKGKIINSSAQTFYLPQKIQYPKGISLFDYLSSIFFKTNWKWYLNKAEKAQITEVLEDLELLDKKNLLLENLSAGEIQKANIALAILSGADLVLLDEPTSNMDLINQMKILDILKHLKTKKLTSVIILHDLNLASNYGDFFIGINKNREIVCAEKQEFFTQKVLGGVYDLEFSVVNNEKSIYIQTFN